MKSCVVFAASIFDQSKLHVLHEYLNIFKNNYNDCDFYIGINHGSINEVEEVISSYKLNCFVVRSPQHLYCQSDASAYQVALKLLKKSISRYELYWFAHTKGAVNHRPDERSMYLNLMFSNRNKIESLFEEYENIGSYALRGVSTSAAGDNWATFNRDHDIQICANLITKDLPYTHVNWSYIETMYVLNKNSVEKFLSLTTDQFYETRIQERCYFEVIFPWIASRCGYFPYIEESGCYFDKNISLKNITNNWIIQNNLLHLSNYLEL